MLLQRHRLLPEAPPVARQTSAPAYGKSLQYDAGYCSRTQAAPVAGRRLQALVRGWRQSLGCVRVRSELPCAHKGFERALWTAELRRQPCAASHHRGIGWGRSSSGPCEGPCDSQREGPAPAQTCLKTSVRRHCLAGCVQISPTVAARAAGLLESPEGSRRPSVCCVELGQSWVSAAVSQQSA